MEALSLELSRVVAERDSLAAQIKADAVTVSDRIHQATKQGAFGICFIRACAAGERILVISLRRV